MTIKGLTLVSGSTRSDMVTRTPGETTALATSWAGMRAVCGACTPALGVLGGGCHGGGLLFHSQYAGSDLEIIDRYVHVWVGGLVGEWVVGLWGSAGWVGGCGLCVCVCV